MTTQTISGTPSIETILASTELDIRSGEYVLVGISPDKRAKLETDLTKLSDTFFQYTCEADVLTVLLHSADWDSICGGYPKANIEGPLRIFSFSVVMDWQVVGFLAEITGILAGQGIPLGAVCGYYRDHLFIAREYAHQAETVLRAKIDCCKQATP